MPCLVTSCFIRSVASLFFCRLHIYKWRIISASLAAASRRLTEKDETFSEIKKTESHTDGSSGIGKQAERLKAPANKSFYSYSSHHVHPVNAVTDPLRPLTFSCRPVSSGILGSVFSWWIHLFVTKVTQTPLSFINYNIMLSFFSPCYSMLLLVLREDLKFEEVSETFITWVN